MLFILLFIKYFIYSNAFPLLPGHRRRHRRAEYRGRQHNVQRAGEASRGDGRVRSGTHQI